jgi:hypothetical protein
MNKKLTILLIMGFHLVVQAQSPAKLVRSYIEATKSGETLPSLDILNKERKSAKALVEVQAYYSDSASMLSAYQLTALIGQNSTEAEARMQSVDQLVQGIESSHWFVKNYNLRALQQFTPRSFPIIAKTPY